MRLIGVIELRVGSILVLREHEDESFSFQNSLLAAYKCADFELVEFLLKFVQLNATESSEVTLNKKKTSSTCLPGWSIVICYDLVNQQFHFVNRYEQ